MPGALIMHVDMDAFFASVEQRDNPALKGQPVVVGGRAEDRGVVAAASYEARRYGVRSAMPMATALKLCPALVIVPPDHPKYARVSSELMNIMGRYTPLVEPLSLDEAFMDITGSAHLFGGAAETGCSVQGEIEKIGLTASVGIGPNKLIAKIASDYKKPRGLTVVKEEDVAAFLTPMDVSRLWGAGPQTVQRLNKIGVRTVGELRELGLEYLTGHFGVAGERLYQMARGIDDRPVTTGRQAKSVSREVTFTADVNDRQLLLDTLLKMSDRVCRQLRRMGLACRGVHLKIKYPDFKTVSRSVLLGEYTGDGLAVYRAAEQLLGQHWDGRPVRLIGVSCDRLAANDCLPGTLFPDPAGERAEKLNIVVDRLLDRYGEGVLVRGRLAGRGREKD